MTNLQNARYYRAISDEYRAGLITMAEMNAIASDHGRRMQQAAMESAMSAMRDSQECPNCGATVEGGIEIGDETFCDRDCAFEMGYRECEECGDWVHMEDGLNICGDWFCSDDCAHDAGYERCEECGEWFSAEDGVEIFDRWTRLYCSDSCAKSDGYRQCDRCGEWSRCTYDVHNGTWQTWCETCYDDYGGICEGCGDHYSWDELTEHNDYNYCEDCLPGCPNVHEYGYVPYLYKMGDSSNSPYLGVELETDGGSDKAGYSDSLAELHGFDELFWMTEDGSLDNGVEITSHPMTLAYHMGIRELYEQIAGTAHEYGYTSHDNGRCGLHIHVSRDFFGKSEAVQDAGGYKMMRLLQRFEKQFTIFARRSDNHWCQYRTSRDYSPKKANLPDDPMDGMLRKSRMMKHEKAHSQALNFQHSATFEFRIFRGTLRLSTYFACLGLVNGMAHVAKSHGSVYVEDVDWYTLMHDVVEAVDDAEARECLSCYLAEKGLA